MNIVIVGPGAIGSLWAYHLHRAGHNVAIWSRRDQPYLRLQLDDQPIIELLNNNVESLTQADLVLVTTKAGQVSQAIPPLIPHLSQDTILLFMHNGMGAIDEFLSSLDAYPLLQATTTHGALKTSAETVKHTGYGMTQIGPINAKGERCTFICDVLQHSLREVNWNLKIEKALWLKLAINCAINPLTAIEGCRNGELNQPRYQTRLNNIVNEISQVADKDGYVMSNDWLLQQVLSVIHATAANYSSMHQDIVYKRQTEIEHITGYLLKRAETHGISLPENQSLYKKIKQLESPRS